MLTIKPFGAFVAIDGFREHGLVHISALAPQRVEAVEDVAKVGDEVWVKILSAEAGRVSCSMKAVDQRSGADLGLGGGGGGGGGGNSGAQRRRAEAEEDLSGMTFGKLQPLDHAPAEADEPDAPKQKANFATSGKLAEDANKVNGVVLKFSEPADAAKPSKHWRLYVFKGKETLEPYHVHRQSAYLLGRERRVADIPLDHPSCSSQHAVLQFRLTPKREADGRETRLVRPYVMDLGSTNGVYVNDARVDTQRYVELLEKDVLRFGYSSREYVILNADAATT